LVHLLGHIPTENSQEVVEYQDLTFTIKKIRDKRIASVELKVK
ncbi:MAG: transporter associated domain-containing protein, partial [Culicoidibacterales bacterium]